MIDLPYFFIDKIINTYVVLLDSWSDLCDAIKK